MSSLSYIDLPSFNLIISTDKNPIVICSEKGTLNALSDKSQVWGGLLYFLNEEYKCINTDLSSAIRAAYNITNARKQEHTDYLLILTDGLLVESERKKVFKEIEYCKSKGLYIIGIGVGLYPYGIENLFPFIVYSRQPNQVIESIALCFSENKTNDNFKLKDPNYDNLTDIFSENKHYFTDFKRYNPDSSLVKHLKDIKVFLNSFTFSLPEIDNKNSKGNLQTVETNFQNAMYPKNYLKNGTAKNHPTFSFIIFFTHSSSFSPLISISSCP